MGPKLKTIVNGLGLLNDDFIILSWFFTCTLILAKQYHIKKTGVGFEPRNNFYEIFGLFFFLNKTKENLKKIGRNI